MVRSVNRDAWGVTPFLHFKILSFLVKKKGFDNSLIGDINAQKQAENVLHITNAIQHITSLSSLGHDRDHQRNDPMTETKQ